MSDPSDSVESERYEVDDLMPGEAPDTVHFVKVFGEVVVVILIILALAYPFIVGNFFSGG